MPIAIALWTQKRQVPRILAYAAIVSGCHRQRDKQSDPVLSAEFVVDLKQTLTKVSLANEA